LKVGAQQITSVGQLGPLAVLVFFFDVNGQAFAAFVVWVVVFADVDLKEACGTGVFLERNRSRPKTQ